MERQIIDCPPAHLQRFSAGALTDQVIVNVNENTTFDQRALLVPEAGNLNNVTDNNAVGLCG